MKSATRSKSCPTYQPLSISIIHDSYQLPLQSQQQTTSHGNAAAVFFQNRWIFTEEEHSTNFELSFQHGCFKASGMVQSRPCWCAKDQLNITPNGENNERPWDLYTCIAEDIRTTNNPDLFLVPVPANMYIYIYIHVYVSVLGNSSKAPWL